MAAPKTQPVRVNELARSSFRHYIDLDGQWDFQLDKQDLGEKAGWQEPAAAGCFTDSIQVPGCLEAQGKGLRHEELCRPELGGGPDVPYLGVSWYRKTFHAPEHWQGRRNDLNFGGVSTDCQVWLNGRLLGGHSFGSVPFGFDVSSQLAYGGTNTIVLRVENRHTYEPGVIRTPEGFGETLREIKWSGVYRHVELVSRPRAASLAEVYIVPDAAENKLICRFTVHLDDPAESEELTVKAAVSPWEGGGPRDEASGLVSESEGTVAVQVSQPRYWSDADPHLYRVELHLTDARGQVLDSLTERAGLRDVDFDGTHICLNGTPVYLRGDMVHYHWPDTISPSTDRDELRRRLMTYKSYGFNYLRHHTHFPTPEYLEVCDEIGLLCHNELGVTCHLKLHGTFPVEQLHELWSFSVQEDRNHPSVIIWCLGNEKYPSGEELELYSRLTFQLDTTRLLQSNSPGFFMREDGSRVRAPVFHELRNCGASYVDSRLKPLYAAGPLRPWRMQWAERQTAEAGLDYQLPQFVRNTQLLQARSRKLILEELRMRSDTMWDIYDFRGTAYSGFELCTFRDSGSFLWGVVDDYFGAKIESPENTRKYTGDTVLLWAHQWQHRIFPYRPDPPVILTLMCSHYGKKPIRGAVLEWSITDSKGDTEAAGRIVGLDAECGQLKVLMSDYHELSKREQPEAFTLTVRLSGDSGWSVSNDWTFWAFPDARFRHPAVPINARVANRFMHDSFLPRICPDVNRSSLPSDGQGIYITDRLDASVYRHLDLGGSVLLLGQEHFPGEVTDWSAGRSEYTRGTIIQDHPLMRNFPHEGWCDIPFAGMMRSPERLDGRHPGHAFAYDLSDFPVELEPIIQAIPSYKADHPKKLGLLFEVQAGPGKLMAATLEFGYPHANAHRHAFLSPAGNYLFVQLLRYMESDRFRPRTGMTLDQLRAAASKSRVADNSSWQRLDSW